MYEEFYGLAEEPFKITPDPRFFYLSKHHEEGLNQLRYGIQRKKGLILFTGEVGTGKTTLLNRLIQRLEKKTHVAFLVDSQTSPLVMLGKIYHAFGLQIDGKTESDASIGFKNFLVNCSHANEDCLLILDESQNLTPEIFEHLRLLLNLETHEEKLLQIILAGHPELHDKLKVDELSNLKQRIEIVYHLSPLNPEETAGYIAHRLSIAGATTSPFTDDAIDEVYRYSRGTPRLINIICDTALSKGLSDDQRHIGRPGIRQAVEYLRVDAPRETMDRNIVKARDTGTATSGETMRIRRQKALARLHVLPDLPHDTLQAEQLGKKTGWRGSRRSIYVGVATGMVLGLILVVGLIGRAKQEPNLPEMLSPSTEPRVAAEPAHTQPAVRSLADTEPAVQPPTRTRLTPQAALSTPADDDIIMGYEIDSAASNHHRTAQAKEESRSEGNVLQASARRVSEGSSGHRSGPSSPPLESPTSGGRKAAGSTANPRVKPLTSDRENLVSKTPRLNAAHERYPHSFAYTVQVGSFRVEADARRSVSELRTKGYHPYVAETRDTQNRIWHKVCIGRFTDIDRAKAIERAFKKRENRDAYVLLTDTLPSGL